MAARAPADLTVYYVSGMRSGADAIAGQLADAAQMTARLGAVMPHATLFAFDRELRFVAARGPMFERHGIPATPALLGRLMTDVMATDVWAAVREHHEAALAGERRTFDYAADDGQTVYHAHIAPLSGPGGDVDGALTIIHDIGGSEAQRREAERKLRQQSALADIASRALEIGDPGALLHYACARAADGSDGHGVGLIVADDEGRLRLAAAAGLPEAELGGEAGPLHGALREQSPLVVDDDNRERFADSLGPLAGEQACLLLALEGAARPGVLVVVCRAGRALDHHDLRFFSSVAGVLSSARDRQDLEGELRQAALQDELTGLPNRTALRDHLRLGLARNQRYDTRLAVFFLDLDGFKEVNDAHGHGVGDAVLRDVAARLLTALRRADLVARFGGDEFVVLCETIAGTHEVDRVVARVRDAFTEPFALDGRRVEIGVSIGVAVVGRETTDPDEALDRADAEMYRAKRAAR